MRKKHEPNSYPYGEPVRPRTEVPRNNQNPYYPRQIFSPKAAGGPTPHATMSPKQYPVSGIRSPNTHRISKITAPAVNSPAGDSK